MPETLTQINIDIAHDFAHELRSPDDPAGVPLASEPAAGLLGELVDEAVAGAALADCMQQMPDSLRVRIRPCFSAAPIVEAIEIELFGDEEAAVYSQKFTAGPWIRESQLTALELREEGTLGENQTALQVLMAWEQEDVEVDLPPLQLPTIVDGSLEDFGVLQLGEGSLVPDRPVLINERFAAEAIEQCIAADIVETGSAVYGQIVRLPDPLPGTSTRVVTILAGTVSDARHVGAVHEHCFSPEALYETQQMCDLRGLGERVLTVFHTHGWNNACGNCNQSASCGLSEAKPSLQDYRLLATLFPGKATLMPIAGRKLGVEEKRPVLQVYAWRKGEMRPIRWQKFED